MTDVTDLGQSRIEASRFGAEDVLDSIPSTTKTIIVVGSPYFLYGFILRAYRNYGYGSQW